MSTGVFGTNGQVAALTALLANTDLYLGLMTQTTNPAVGAYIGSGITEVTGGGATGYARIKVNKGVAGTDWTLSGGAGELATALAKTFTAGTDGIASVGGWFLSKVTTGDAASDIIGFGVVEAARQGAYANTDTLTITATLLLKDTSQ